MSTAPDRTPLQDLEVHRRILLARFAHMIEDAQGLLATCAAPLGQHEGGRLAEDALTSGIGYSDDDIANWVSDAERASAVLNERLDELLTATHKHLLAVRQAPIAAMRAEAGLKLGEPALPPDGYTEARATTIRSHTP